MTGEYVDMIKAGIIDPAKVTRGALENAASIAAMILTTEALITDMPEKDKPRCTADAGVLDRGPFPLLDEDVPRRKPRDVFVMQTLRPALTQSLPPLRHTPPCRRQCPGGEPALQGGGQGVRWMVLPMPRSS